jgi:hypothetical protein
MIVCAAHLTLPSANCLIRVNCSMPSISLQVLSCYSALGLPVWDGHSSQGIRGSGMMIVQPRIVGLAPADFSWSEAL